MAGVLSLIANPFCRYIDNFKIYKGHSLSSAASAGITLVLIVALFGGIIALFVPTLVKEVNTFANLDQQRVLDNFKEPIALVEEYYNRFDIGEGKQFGDFANEKVKDYIGTNAIGQAISGLFMYTSEFLTALISILFMAFFFLKDEKLFLKSILLLFPNNLDNQAAKVFNDSKKLLINYFQGLVLQVIEVSVLAWLGLYILGVPNALLLGVLLGFLNIIPFVGAFIAAALAILLSVSTNLYGNFYTELLPVIYNICIVYTVVHVLDSYIIANYIFSKSVKAHPVEIFVVILCGANIGGIGAMMVAIPTYSVLRIIVKEVVLHFGTNKIEVS